MNALAPLYETFRRPVAGLERRIDRTPTLRRATVTGIGPLRVQYDGETSPAAASPETLVPVGPGDRVMVAHHRTQATIVGVIGNRGRPWREAVGTVDITGTGETTAGAVADLPAGHFTVPPAVFFTSYSSVYVVYRGAGTSSSQLGVGVRRFDGAPFDDTVTVSWHAIQMTPTTAGG